MSSLFASARLSARAQFGPPPLAANIEGTPGPDTLNGTENDDTIRGQAGGDLIHGAGGDDRIHGANANDDLFGDAGDDLIDGGFGQDLVEGGDGDDRLYGGGGADTIRGGDGVDTAFLGRFFTGDEPGGATVDLGVSGPQDTGDGLDVFFGVENLVGTRHADSLTGDDGNNVLDGGLSSSGGTSDTLTGGLGDDILRGGEFSLGSDGDDQIHTFGGRAFIDGSRGNDRIDPRHGGEITIFGGGEIDLVTFFEGDGMRLDLSHAGAQAIPDGTVTISGVEDLSATAENDVIRGSRVANRLYGDEGADWLKGGGGEDVLYGDASIDASWRFLDLASPLDPNVDTLLGGNGADTLVGGVKGDVLTGGRGADVFRIADRYDTTFTGFDTTPASTDLITDLEAQDSIDIAVIDADSTRGGNNAFVLVADFSGAAGELRLVYEAGDDVTRIEGDTDGDETADLLILASGDRTGFTGFVL